MKLIEYSFYEQLNHSTRIEAHTYHIITDESGIIRFVVVVAQDGKVLWCQTTNSPIRAWNIYESSPFSRKKFLSLCSIVKTTEWNGLIKIDY